MTTQRVIESGAATEANPFLLRSTDPLQMAAMKTGGAVLTVYITRKVRRAGHPVLATLTNFAASSALLWAARHNNRIWEQAGRR